MIEPQLLVYNSLEVLSLAAAGHFTALAVEAEARRGRFLVALSGGTTPKQLYHCLARPPFRDLIPWSAMHVFWGDERCVQPAHPESNFRQAQESLLAYVPVPDENIHRVKGDWHPETAAAEYRAELQVYAEEGRRWPCFDLVLLGMGADGHTASLFPGPGPEPHLPVIPVTADYAGRPANRISLTPLVFNDARNVIFLASGEGKARALAAVLRGPYAPEQWPAQRIQPWSGRVTWYADRAAAAGLDSKELK
jgi:6-phosphogluconolactonase